MRSRILAAAVLSVLALISCQKNSTTGPSNDQTFTGTVSGNGFNQHGFTTGRAGTMTLRLSWTGQNDLDLYLTTSACNSYPPGNQPGCPIIVRSSLDSGSVETLTRSVSANEAFKAWVDNFSPGATSYTLTMKIE